MTSDGARWGEGTNTADRLRDGVASLPGLRLEGLRLAGAGDAEGFAAWHCRWVSRLDEIRSLLAAVAPRQTRLVLWPSLNTQAPGQIRAELVRAAVGCRELALLVGELDGGREGTPENSAIGFSPEESHQGATYVRPGRRLEGAIRLRRLIAPARDSLFVVDPYMDDGTFTLAAAAPRGVSRRFLTSNHRNMRATVAEAWAHWQAGWEGDSQCRMGSELPHFRLLLVDGAPYHIDSSLKDFGATLTVYWRLPTLEWESIRGDVESAWRQASPI